MRFLHACPPSCKHQPADLTDSSEPARERLRALKTIDRMVAAGLAKSTDDDRRA